MRWLIFSYEQTAIVRQCSDLLQTAGQIVLHDQHHGKASLEKIKDKIIEEKPDRIIIIISYEDELCKDSSLVQILNNQLLIPIYVCQATATSYSPIPILLLTFTNENNLSDECSSMTIIQNAMNELVNHYSPIINARIFTPISDEDFTEENLLKKFQKNFWNNNPDKSHHLTILSDMLPILLALIHDRKVNGQIDVCNKGTISLNWFEQFRSKDNKNEQNQFVINDQENLTDKLDNWNVQMISPEIRHLYRASFVLPNIRTTIGEYFRQKSIQIDPNSPRTLLVTGGCGFIGSTFINYWLETYPQDKIINIDRLDPVSNTKNISNPQSANYSLIVANINNKDIVLHLMRQYNITHIVHCAVQAHVDTSFGNSITFTESNVYGTHSVLEASRIYGKIQKFLHLSTDEVYGETPSGSYQETNLLNPINPYAATIAAAEFLVKSYGESFKMSYCIIRLSNVYGPRQHIEKVIPTFIHNLFQGEKLKITGNGEQIRHYIYIDDVIKAIDIIFHKGKIKMIYNIGSEDELNVLDIAKKVLRKIRPNENFEDQIIFVKARSFQEKRYSITTNGAIKSLGWNAQVSFDQGLEKTIQWYRENPNYWNK